MNLTKSDVKLMDKNQRRHVLLVEMQIEFEKIFSTSNSKKDSMPRFLARLPDRLIRFSTRCMKLAARFDV
jgi:hypothetical protein